MRNALYRESIAFLAGNDEASMRQLDAKRLSRCNNKQEDRL
jgi:hypothetical protein